MEIDVYSNVVAAAASEAEANERGRLHYRGLQSLFLLNARNCGYTQV